MCGLGFAAVCTGVLVTSGTLPSGRHESVAVVMCAAMNEGVCVMVVVVVGIMHTMIKKASFCLHEITAKSEKLLDLRGDVLDLIVNALNEPVMGDGSLCGRKHGLFLREENVFLVSREFAV